MSGPGVMAARNPAKLPPERIVLDATELPDVTFGHRNHVWWGTLLFAVIEASTLVISVFAYFYLQRHFDQWPPPRIELPDLLAGTATVAVLLASLFPAWKAKTAGRELDMGAVRRWQVILSIFSAAIIVLRSLELANLNTRWDENAYGSVVWVMIGFHTTLLVVDVLETWMVTVLSFKGPWQTKHFADVEDGAFYWWFTVLAWVPLYVVLYLYPR